VKRRPGVLWLRRHAVLVVAGLGTAGLLTIAVLAMTGSVLSRVDEIEGERGGTLTVVSVEASPDLDPARINDVYGTMIARAVHRTPYTFRPDREEGAQPDLAEGTPEISDDSRRVRITIRSGVHFSPPVNREVTARGLWHRPRLPSGCRLAAGQAVLRGRGGCGRRRGRPAHAPVGAADP
jgi:ABC-type transport system substrate-binding protein